jgi:hypothetical protein
MKTQEWPIPDEQLARLFTPHLVLPEQYFDGDRRRPMDGERRLLLAILEDAVQIYCKGSIASAGRNRRLFREAERWVESRDRRWVFSFERICDALDLDADYIRRGLQAWRRDRGARRFTVLITPPSELHQASGE